MSNGTVLWAGKRLSRDEDAALRRVVSMLGRTGRAEQADYFRRFLPEYVDDWSPDDLEAGAHLGPWMSFEAAVEVDDDPRVAEGF